MKVRRHLPAGEHGNITWKKVVQRGNQAFGRNSVLRVEATAKPAGMNAGVCSAASFDIRACAGHLFQRLLKNLLYADRVSLYLPAMVGRAVIAERQQ